MGRAAARLGGCGGLKLHGAHPAEIQNQHRSCPGGAGLLCKGQRIGAGTAGVLHGWMENRITETEIQAEHHPGRADQVCNRLKV